jgi:hypothetical protein
MFTRRVFSSAPIPRQVWSSLHIQSRAQALRVLPSLVPLLTTPSAVGGRTLTQFMQNCSGDLEVLSPEANSLLTLDALVLGLDLLSTSAFRISAICVAEIWNGKFTREP